MALQRRKKGDKLEVWTIMGKSNHCWNPEHGNIQDREGSWKQESQDRPHAETKTKTLWRRGRPTRTRQGRTGRDTKGRRIQEESKTVDEEVSKEDENQIATPFEQSQQETLVQDKAEEDRENEEQQDTESEQAERETTELEDKEDEKNKKHYNLRKRKGRTVYVSA
jgi:hypothetical protein